MAIYITGDIHGSNDIKKLNMKNFPEQKNLTKKDYVIICGDFGLVWKMQESYEEKYWLDWLENKSFTTLFVDGNHENHIVLNSFPVEKWKGGKTHKLRNSVIHLMRGQVFNICDKKIFTLGGASSIDKDNRIEGLSWWKEEIPSSEELKEAMDNCEKHDFKFDHIITHCAPYCIESKMFPEAEMNALNVFLQGLMKHCEYESFYTGHYHIDEVLDVEKKIITVYDEIIKL